MKMTFLFATFFSVLTVIGQKTSIEFNYNSKSFEFKEDDKSITEIGKNKGLLFRIHNGNVYVPQGAVNMNLVVNSIPESTEVSVNRTNLDIVFEAEEKEGIKSGDSLNLPNFHTQTFALDPFENDISTITIKAKKTTDDTTGNKDTEEVDVAKLRIKTYGRYKVDFSSGFAFSGFLNPDKEYFLTSTGADTSGTYLINKANRNDVAVPISVAAMLHAYQTWSRRWTMGVSVGLGFDEDSPKYFAGLGILLGEEQRFVINMGVMLRKVKDLKSQYKAGEIVELTEDQGVHDIMTEYYRPDFGFAITYNLTSKTK